MCSTKSPITLNETEVAQISWCPGCESYSLVYCSGYASFTPEELTQFFQMLTALSPDNFCYGFKGQPHTIIRGSQSYMGFCLNRNDVYALKSLIRGALTIHETYRILHH